MTLTLDYGAKQQFRRRTYAVTVRGKFEDVPFPVAASGSLNGIGFPLYVEQQVDLGVDWLAGYKPSPAELRCRDRGEFCVEIDVDDPGLRRGGNELKIEGIDAAGTAHSIEATFEWNEVPPSLPLDLRDLSTARSLLDVGQPVNGAFDLDLSRNVIRSRAPVAPDALLVLGPPSQSQEATYAVRFLETEGAKWLGCSDFFAGLTEGVPSRGIRVGWSSAGMAALSPRDGARSFIAWGDHSGDHREWAVATNPASPVAVERQRLYRVRHQLALTQDISRVRWKIWPADQDEPVSWICDENSAAVPAGLPLPNCASFALFQHMGSSIEWSDILVRSIDPIATGLLPVDGSAAREPFLKRARPGAF